MRLKTTAIGTGTPYRRCDVTNKEDFICLYRSFKAGMITRERYTQAREELHSRIVRSRERIRECAIRRIRGDL